MTEILAMFWFTLCVFIQSSLVNKKNSFYALLVGISWGIMALNKAIFLYLAPGILITMGGALVYCNKKNDRNFYLIIKWTAVSLLSFFMLVGSYMARNYITMGNFTIAERGGLVLDVRANLNKMTWPEYISSFNCWRNIQDNAIRRKTFDLEHCRNLTDFHSQFSKGVYEDT